VYPSLDLLTAKGNRIRTRTNYPADSDRQLARARLDCAEGVSLLALTQNKEAKQKSILSQQLAAQLQVGWSNAMNDMSILNSREYIQNFMLRYRSMAWVSSFRNPSWTEQHQGARIVDPSPIRLPSS